MEPSFQLFSYFRSSCAYRVRIALQLKQIPYTLKTVHLLKDGGQQHSADYKKINASQQVPTLIDDDKIVGQSIAILEYLEEEFPQVPLLPTKAYDKALVRQMCEIINSGIQPLQNLTITQYLTQKLKVSEEEKTLWLHHWIQRGFSSYEALLEKHSGTYSFGDKVTFADCCLIPQVYSAKRFGVDLQSFPRSLEIYNRCSKNVAFISASPEKQPDYQP